MTPKEVRQNCRKNEETGCLEWQGRLDKSGYPVAYCDGRSRYVSRIAWESRYKTTLSRSTALHRLCDNERCVEPSHYEKRDIAAPITPYKLESGDKWRLRDTPAEYKALSEYEKALSV